MLGTSRIAESDGARTVMSVASSAWPMFAVVTAWLNIAKSPSATMLPAESTDGGGAAVFRVVVVSGAVVVVAGRGVNSGTSSLGTLSSGCRLSRSLIQ